MSRARIRTVLAAALLCLTACGKKDGATPTSVLPVPGAIENVSAQAEVKASSGPVELTFLLHKTEIKAGDYLWQQIRIRNIGEKELVVVDQVFHDPRDLRGASSAGYGIYLEALGPDGSPMEVRFQLPVDMESDQPEAVSGLLEVEGPKEQAMLDGWKKQGLKQVDIDRKLIDFNMKKRSAAADRKRRPIIKLPPGKSAETKSAFFYSMTDKRNGKPVPKPRGDFAQIDFFRFDESGRYMVRAVYNHAPTKHSMETDRKFHHGPDPSEVLVLTPWIAVTVLK